MSGDSGDKGNELQTVVLFAVIFALFLLVLNRYSYLFIEAWRYIRIVEITLFSWMPEWVVGYGSLPYEETLKILKLRGESMQNAVPKGIGGMLAVLGTTTETIEKILDENKDNFQAQIANDNSDGQIVVSGKLEDLKKMMENLKENKIKNIQLPVSAPFHCSLMEKATENMREPLNNLSIEPVDVNIVSNVTALAVNEPSKIKELLIKQIENRVRWRESILKMIGEGVDNFIEIGPGKVLAGLIKRINKQVKTISINSEDDIKSINV